MRVLNCDFPDDLYYDLENDVWFKPEGGRGKTGISTELSFLAGKITKVKLKSDLTDVTAGKSLGTIESSLYFGAIRSPLSGKIASVNSRVQDDPNLLNRSRFTEGWIAEYESFDQSSLSRLVRGESAKQKLEARIRELRVNCFKLLPDDSMYSIGTECATTLASLDQLLSERPVGSVVHLVTDDPTADIELVRWTMRTKNELVEARKEDNLFHFILRKTN